MKTVRALLFIPAILLVATALTILYVSQADAQLPIGIKAVWDLEKAYRENTKTRERVCLNGLWRWQPVKDIADVVPSEKWGYFKVPGSWPGITDSMHKDSQTVYAHPRWKDESPSSFNTAWYQREITIPNERAGRRIAVSVEYLNSYAVVYVDEKKAGEIRFPGGEVDITSLCRPGSKHLLSMLVVAMPLKGVMLSYNDTASAREVKGSVARRGLCGDVYLVSVPSGARIADAKVDTSVSRGEITFDAALQGLDAEGLYTLSTRITDKERIVMEFTSKVFKGRDLSDGRIAFTEKWKPSKLWDIHTPQNMFNLQFSLLGAGGTLLDTGHVVRFGFREFRIDGRDFFLNGARIFLSSVPLDNAQAGAALANYEGAKESLLRLKSFGINLVYTHNYGCQPGSHLSFAEILRAADDVGMLVSFSQPHFGHYEWQASDADRTNGYARHAEFYVRAAQNHPAVVMYSMSHNATGYSEDMNPDMIDGIKEARDTRALKNSRLALRAEAIVKRLDPGRIVYHHSSGNLGSMHTSNFYPNFVPIQEQSDWFEHWATTGVKPVFTVEYATPSTWDWTMYRGWYKGERAYGRAKVPWEFCLAEWNSQFLGDRAFQISGQEKTNLRWEAKQFQTGNRWLRWDYPYHLDSRELAERYPVFAMYLNDNWRAFRTWGVSANHISEYGNFWKLREGVDKGRKEFKVDWENLQQPGFSPDYIEQRYERMDMAYERSDWVATAAAQALMRNNLPLLAYIGGKPSRFTSKDHNFLPGETVEKQAIIINNSRETVSAECEWSFGLPRAVTGARKVSVKTGEQERIPLQFDLPATLAPGAYKLDITVKFSKGDTQKDSFVVHVLPQTPSPKTSGKIAIFDPGGETGRLLNAKGIWCSPVEANTDLSAYDILIVGKNALTVGGPAPDITRVRDGLKVIVFEQTSEVLEKRFGFRVTEYGLRQVFRRAPDHPLLAGISVEHMRDWRGEATILPPRLKYELSKTYGAPAVRWCDIEVTRAWRCGNRGNVASVLIEKPVIGDFLPIVDGGFSLQYSPLMEYREGKGMVLFCQMDVTGRTEMDPAAEMLVRNILDYAATWGTLDNGDRFKPVPISPHTSIGGQISNLAPYPPRRKALYVGDAAGKSYLKEAGISLDSYEGGNLSADQVLIVGPGGGPKLAGHAAAVDAWLKAGGNLLLIGSDEQEANAFLPIKVRMKKAEHISAYFDVGSPTGTDLKSVPINRQTKGTGLNLSPLPPLFAGIGPADVHNRDPRDLFLVTEGASVIGNGVLARAETANVVFSQLVPWQFDYKKQNTKRTYRRTSFLVSRLLANMGVSGSTPLLARFHNPIGNPGIMGTGLNLSPLSPLSPLSEKRWLEGFYLDTPEEWDYPYRFFRW